MSITTTPAPARTDVPTTTTPAITAAGVRKLGVTMGAGALIWATSIAAVGSNPTDSLGISIADLGAVPFQIGLFALVTAQLKTRATGTTRFAVGMLKTEYVLLTLATLWSVFHGAVPAFRDDLWLGILDLFWPLSMLGMFVIGVKIAFAGRWTGLARFWPSVAESWAVVCVPTMAIFGDGAVRWVGSAHLLVGYAALGLILALRPRLTGAR
jgi:hypothetical protein